MAVLGVRSFPRQPRGLGTSASGATKRDGGIKGVCEVHGALRPSPPSSPRQGRKPGAP